jgi:transcription initiation factor IIE alpha subunit
VKSSKARNTHPKASSPTSDFLEDIDRDTVAQAYQHITQFLNRYKNNIEFVTKEELVAVTNIKESIVERVLDKLKKVGVLSVRSKENNNNKISPYTCYYINKDNLKNH